MCACVEPAEHSMRPLTCAVSWCFRKKRATDWVDNVHNNWIYVTGLPSDVTEEELVEHFSKAGVLAINPATATPKVKIYR